MSDYCIEYFFGEAICGLTLRQMYVVILRSGGVQ